MTSEGIDAPICQDTHSGSACEVLASAARQGHTVLGYLFSRAEHTRPPAGHGSVPPVMESPKARQNGASCRLSALMLPTAQGR
jgi:hypothetical protein